MNKNILIKSLILSGLVILAPQAFAQKPDPSGKTSTPRTDTVTVSTVLPPNSTTTTTTNTNTASNTVVSTTGANNNSNPTTTTSTNANDYVPVTGTTETGSTTATNTTTGVQGTSTTPTDLNNTSQVGGVDQSNSSNNNGKGGGGKKVKKMKTPGPATQTNLVVPVNGVSGATTEATSTTVTNTSTNSATNTVTDTSTGTSTGTSTVSTTTTPNTDQPNVSGVQTIQTSAVNGKSCEDEALKEVYKIISTDQNNAFAKMVELTTMKLAKKALAEGNVTLEGYTQTKIGEFETYFNKSKEAGGVRDKVVAAYALYGKSSDAAVINQDLDAALAKGKEACYWSSKTHLPNKDVGAFILAMSAADSNSGLTDADAATVWALDKIRATAKTGGQLEITNRVARYLGAIQGGTEMSKEELDAAIAAQENEIKTLISNARTQAEKNLIACIEQQNPSCAECQLKAKENLISSTSSLEQVQRGLALAVQKADTVAMVNKFKGKAGDIDFSLDNITRGSVQKDPSRLKGFDACGTPVVHSTRTSSNSSSGNLPQDYNCVNGQCLNSNGQSYVSTGDGVVYDNGTSPESSVTQYNPYAYNLETYKAEADATYVAPRYTVPTGQPFVVIGKGASAAGAAMTKITQMVKTPDGCAKLGGIWSQPNNRCEVKDLKTGKSYGKALVLGSSTTAKVMAKIAQMVKTPSGCIQAGGVWSKQNKRCEAPATYQAFYDRDPLIKSVKDFMIPVVKTVVQANYTIAKKTYQTTKDYVLPTLGQMALFPYNVAVKTTKTVVNATKRNPAATKSIVTNSLIPGWNLYYYASPWGFAYDAYKMMK